MSVCRRLVLGNHDRELHPEYAIFTYHVPQNCTNHYGLVYVAYVHPHVAMAQADPRTTEPDGDAEEYPSKPLAAWLEGVSQELDPTECEDLTELNNYSIHEHDSARTITVPADADAFEEATTVKQYYFEGDACPLLLVAPLDP
jgi:hypothetical protein